MINSGSISVSVEFAVGHLCSCNFTKVSSYETTEQNRSLKRKPEILVELCKTMKAIVSLRCKFILLHPRTLYDSKGREFDDVSSSDCDTLQD